MVHQSLRAVIAGALIAIGSLGAAYAAPIAPTAMRAPSSPPVKLVSFWGQPFPYGYRYFHGQCYAEVPVETPTGIVWRRVWVCETDHYGYGYGGRF